MFCNAKFEYLQKNRHYQVETNTVDIYLFKLSYGNKKKVWNTIKTPWRRQWCSFNVALIYLFIYLFIHPFIYLFIYLFTYSGPVKITNETKTY